MREVAVSGLEDPMLCIRIVEANIDFQPIRMEEVEDNIGAPNEEDAESQNAVDAPLQKEEVHPEDELSEEVLPSSEHEDRPRRGIRRARSSDSEDERGIDLPQLKKRRAVELPSASEDDWSPRCPPRQPNGRWADEGPSDPRVEVWEEWWDDQLQKQFEEETEALKLREAAEDLEEEESDIEEGNNEEVDVYRTKYID